MIFEIYTLLNVEFMKKSILILGMVLISLVACKKETAEVATTETAVVSVDSVVAGMETIAYLSEDGKTEFSVVYDADRGLASVTNVTTGETYQMKNVVSASGAKFQDDNGYYFWSSKDGFLFGKDDKDLVKGQEKK